MNTPRIIDTVVATALDGQHYTIYWLKGPDKRRTGIIVEGVANIVTQEIAESYAMAMDMLEATMPPEEKQESTS